MEPNKTWTLSELAQILGGSVENSPDFMVERPALADDEDPAAIAFAESEQFLTRAEASTIGALLIGGDLRASTKPSIRVPNARQAFFRLLMMSHRPIPSGNGIDPHASVHPGATIDETAYVGPFAVIECGAVVGPKAKIYAQAYIGENCEIGAGTIVLPGAVLLQDVKLGERCLIQPGAILGADGFGFFWDGQRRIKIPQVGGVALGNDVEIGANTTVDRAMAGSTRIGSGTKIDNLVQIGHNVRIGEHSVLAGMCGISGSTKIGSRVVMGGGAGTRDQITIGDDVTLGGRSGVDKDILEPGEYFGTPARPAREALRTFLLLPKLGEIYQRLRDLEKKVGP